MQIQNFLSQWEALASDAIIVQTVKGEIIDFIAGPPSSLVYPSNTIAKEHVTQIDKEISNLLNIKVIVALSRTWRIYFTNLLFRDQSDAR